MVKDPIWSRWHSRPHHYLKVTINPLDGIGICFNKHKMMYKLLATSIITPYKSLWTYGVSGHICVCGWLSVKCSYNILILVFLHRRFLAYINFSDFCPHIILCTIMYDDNQSNFVRVCSRWPKVEPKSSARASFCLSKAPVGLKLRV